MAHPRLTPRALPIPRGWPPQPHGRRGPEARPRRITRAPLTWNGACVRVLAVRRVLRIRPLLLLLHHRCVHVSAAAAGAGRCLLLLLLLLLRYLLLLLLLLKILRILVRRKLGVSRVRSKVTLATVAVAVHGTRD